MKKKKAARVIKRARSIKLLISNIVWFFLGGLWLGLIFAVIGILLSVTLIGIPFGKVCLKHALIAMFPYGKKVEIHSGRRPVANVLWAIFVGWWFSLICLVTGVLCIMTVIGFFRGLQAFKLARLTFFPFGAEIT